MIVKDIKLFNKDLRIVEMLLIFKLNLVNLKPFIKYKPRMQKQYFQIS